MSTKNKQILKKSRLYKSRGTIKLINSNIQKLDKNIKAEKMVMLEWGSNYD